MTVSPFGPHPLHLPALPTLADFRESQHRPLVFTKDPIGSDQVICGSKDVRRPLPINGGLMPFESDYFVGHVMVDVRGLQTSPVDTFKANKKFAQITLQGKWKVDMAAGALWMGQKLLRTPKTVPSSLLNMAFHGGARIFSSTYKVDFSDNSPQFMNPILAACQRINVAREGEEPSIVDVQEDMRLVNPKLVDKKGNPLSGEKRMKHYDNEVNLGGLMTGTEYVWTFQMHQSIMDLKEYRLNLSRLLQLDLLTLMEGQPLQIMVLDIQNGKRALSLLVWHEKLVYPQGEESALAIADNSPFIGAQPLLRPSVSVKLTVLATMASLGRALSLRRTGSVRRTGSMFSGTLSRDVISFKSCNSDLSEDIVMQADRTCSNALERQETKRRQQQQQQKQQQAAGGLCCGCRPAVRHG